MSTFTGNTLFYSDTAADFNAWASVIAAFITGCGWVQSSDTGQLVFATNTSNASSAANTVVGYQIYQSSDNLTPFFLKVEYGSFYSQPNTAGLWISVGTSTDGAGNLTGNVSSRLQAGVQSPNFPATIYGSGDPSRFVLAINANGTVICDFGISISRTRDNSLNPTNDGINVMVHSNLGFSQQFVSFGAAAPAFPQPPLGSPMCSAPMNFTGASPQKLGVFPIFVYRGYADNPDGNFLGYFNSDVPLFTVVPVTIGGQIHRYIAMPQNSSSQLNGNTLPTGFLVRYE